MYSFDLLNIKIYFLWVFDLLLFVDVYVGGVCELGVEDVDVVDGVGVLNVFF